LIPSLTKIGDSSPFTFVQRKVSDILTFIFPPPLRACEAHASIFPGLFKVEFAGFFHFFFIVPWSRCCLRSTHSLLASSLPFSPFFKELLHAEIRGKNHFPGLDAAKFSFIEGELTSLASPAGPLSDFCTESPYPRMAPF